MNNHTKKGAGSSGRKSAKTTGKNQPRQEFPCHGTIIRPKEYLFLPRRFLNLLFLSLACALLAQEPMNNDGIIKLVKSGMTEDLIVNVIQQQPGSYTFGANDLVTLKEASVSEKIISAMLAKGKGDASAGTPGGPAGPAGPGKAAPNSGTRSSISGPGLYYKKGTEYFELLTEDVEWKTSGGMKNIVSAGIVKKNLNGTVAGASSRNFLTNPMEIVLSPGGGVTVNSYILLPMRPNKGLREFAVGPVNKSGVAKGAIPFGVERVGENQFRMVLQTPLAPGEYGILAALPSDSSTGSSKMHTFRIL
jgi:hypothetical protein